MKRSNIAVCLSGGVDSSVSAFLLKKKHSVTGVFGRFFSNNNSEERVKRICEILKIPFLVVDLRKEFKKKVIDRFTKELKTGATPNPCVFCNKEIKFGALLDNLSEFDLVATGHYVIKKGDKMFMGKDQEKDQSYFLWMLSKEQIRRVVFPLGEHKKREVIKLAKDLDLPVAEESQDLCFGGVHLGGSPGDIVSKKGVFLGEHEGSSLYTIGQRKGLNLPGGPYYVLEKKGNTVIVSKEKKDLYRREVDLRDVNIDKPLPLEVEAKIRYGAPLKKALLEKNKLTFLTPQFAVCPGQSAVFYKNRELLGGGIIK